jgi:two-component system KDP operon response regulator KdpE
MKVKTTVMIIGTSGIDPMMSSLAYLLADYYEVVRVPRDTNCSQVAKLLDQHRSDIILLDDLEICSCIRRYQTSVPIIMVSADMAERRLVEALDRGADDYIVEPFSREEFLARIRAHLRRARVQRATSQDHDALEVLESEDGYLSMNIAARRVLAGNQAVSLTPTEFELLRLLMLHAGKALTHHMLLRTVWGPEYGHETNYLRIYIRQLRVKIEKDPSHPCYILTEPRVGYRLCTPVLQSAFAREEMCAFSPR